MRTSGEGNVTAPIPLAGRQRVCHAGEAAALALAPCRFVSCLLWRTAADWSIPPRRLDDLFIFVPLSGRLAVGGPGGRAALRPGAMAVIPAGTEHAIAYAGRTRTCRVLALHAHIDAPDGAPWPFPRDRLVARLPGHRRWIAQLTRLAGLAADHPALGAAIGRTLVRALLVDAVLAGHPARAPQVDLDPRLAAIVRAVQADPAGAAPVAQLARAQGIGPLRLRQLFHAGLGCAPKAWVDRQRLARAAEALRGGATVATAARAGGFGTVRQLQARFRAAYGCPPSAWAAEAGRRGM